MAEYEKSQEEAIRHTILGEYGPATLASDPSSSRKSSSPLLHASEGGTRWAGLMGEGQTLEGPSWWSQLRDPWDSRPSQPQEEGTGDSWGTGSKSNWLPRYQTPVTTSTPYITGGYQYQGSSVGPSGGPPDGGDWPRGRGCGGGGGDGYVPGDGDEEEDKDDATSSSSENQREVPPEGWTNGSGEWLAPQEEAGLWMNLIQTMTIPMID